VRIALENWKQQSRTANNVSEGGETYLKLHVDPKGYSSKPSDEVGVIKKRLQNSNTITDISLTELMLKISQGHCISPGVMIGGAKAENWTEQQLFMVDIDNNADEDLANKLKIDVSELKAEQRTPILQVNEALQVCELHNLPLAFNYYSFSHSDQKTKYRLCFVMDEVITDTDTRGMIIETLISLFPQSDKSCTNADRIFYGTNKEVVPVDFDARISVEEVLEAYTPPPQQQNYKTNYDADSELNRLKREFGLFEYMKERNGDIINSGKNYTMFEKCEICGHKKDLVYFHDTNSFCCWGGGEKKGGSIIDYLMLSQNMPIKEAIEHFLYDMCKVPRPGKDTAGKLKDEIMAYDFSDIGIATRFKDKLKDELKYAVDSKYYYRWQKNQHRWVRYDNELPVSTLAMDFCKDLRLKVKEYVNNNVTDKQELIVWERIDHKLGKDSTITMISKRYNSFSDVHILSTMFDSDVRYINCKNGVIDTITGTLLEHEKNLFITKYVDVDYIEGRTNDLFKGSIEHMFGGDPDEIEAFEVLLGYMLSGKANQKTFPIMYGVANSGKSGIFENIIETFGKSYVTTMTKDLMMKVWNKSNGANQEIIELQGIRLVVTSETDDGDYLDTAWAKKLVGGDTIKGRPLYKPSIEFRPEFVPVIFTNDAPKFNGNDEGIVNRLVIIELLHALDKEEINPNFREDCQKDKEGIFSYLVSCTVKYHNVNRLIISDRWQQTKTEKIAENNPYLEFKNRYIAEKQGSSIDMRDLHELFEEWYKLTYSYNVPSRTKITRELKKLLNVTQTHGFNYVRDATKLRGESPTKEDLAEEGIHPDGWKLRALR